MVARTKNIVFWRPQIIKAREFGLSSINIHKLLNRVNGDQHQITYFVKSKHFLKFLFKYLKSMVKPF